MFNSTFKCRKCRYVLFDDGVLVNAHGIQLQLKESDAQPNCTDLESTTVWFIGEDKFPDWIRTLVNESNWLKGKIICPKCSGRLGSFDFTTGSKCKCGKTVLPSVHVSKGRVDFETTDSPSDRTISTSPSLRHLFPVLDASRTPVYKPIKKPDANVKADSRRTSSDFTVRATVVTHSSAARPLLTLDPSKGHQQRRGNTISAPTEKENAVQESLTCPICLEVFYCPTVCHPCSHVFCDPCLRRLAQRKPTKTPCPLCRRIIRQCTPHSEYQQQILIRFPCQHASRKAAAQETRNWPLPWKPRYHLQWLSRESDPQTMTTPWQRLWGWGSIFSLHIQVSTLSLLLILLGVCVVTCVGGFVCMKYALWLLQVSSETCHSIVSHLCVACLLALFRLCIDQYMTARRNLVE